MGKLWEGDFPERALWPRGPWDDEPDNTYWQHVGYCCLAIRGPVGAWCGYVAVPPSHSFWGKSYNECIFECEPDQEPKLDPSDTSPMAQLLRDRPWRDMPIYSCAHRIERLVSAHGGATYGSYGNEFIAHPHADPHAWYIGFDCAHAWDLAPAMEAVSRILAEVDPALGALRRHIEARGDPLRGVYRTIDYVRKEVNNLAEQCAGYGRPKIGFTHSRRREKPIASSDEPREPP